jgi:hypothetical protein
VRVKHSRVYRQREKELKEKELQKKELDREREFEIKYLQREAECLRQVLSDAVLRETVNAERELQAQQREN